MNRSYLIVHWFRFKISFLLVAPQSFIAGAFYVCLEFIEINTRQAFFHTTIAH